MSKTKAITLPAYIECRDDDTGASAFYPVEMVCLRPGLQQSAVDQRQLSRVLATVQRSGLWPEMARRTAERPSGPQAPGN